MFKNYTGNVEELDSAEAFFYWIVKIPDFTLHMELMLFSKEFPTQAGALSNDFVELQKCCRLILDSVSFQNFLHFALHVGNVLNSVSTVLGHIFIAI